MLFYLNYTYALGLLMDFQSQKTAQKAFVSETNENKYGNQAFSESWMCFTVQIV